MFAEYFLTTRCYDILHTGPLINVCVCLISVFFYLCVVDPEYMKLLRHFSC